MTAIIRTAVVLVVIVMVVAPALFMLAFRLAASLPGTHMSKIVATVDSADAADARAALEGKLLGVLAEFAVLGAIPGAVAGALTAWLAPDARPAHWALVPAVPLAVGMAVLPPGYTALMFLIWPAAGYSGGSLVKWLLPTSREAEPALQ